MTPERWDLERHDGESSPVDNPRPLVEAEFGTTEGGTIMLMRLTLCELEPFLKSGDTRAEPPEEALERFVLMLTPVAAKALVEGITVQLRAMAARLS